MNWRHSIQTQESSIEQKQFKNPYQEKVFMDLDVRTKRRSTPKTPHSNGTGACATFNTDVSLSTTIGEVDLLRRVGTQEHLNVLGRQKTHHVVRVDNERQTTPGWCLKIPRDGCDNAPQMNTANKQTRDASDSVPLPLLAIEKGSDASKSRTTQKQSEESSVTWGEASTQLSYDSFPLYYNDSIYNMETDNALRRMTKIETKIQNLIPIHALLDSGATANFVSDEFIKKHNIPKQKLDKPKSATTASGEQLSITHSTIIPITIENHSESVSFLITNLDNHPMILGHTWLAFHNPELNWRTGKLEFTRCPSSCSISPRVEHSPKEGVPKPTPKPSTSKTTQKSQNPRLDCIFSFDMLNFTSIDTDISDNYTIDDSDTVFCVHYNDRKEVLASTRTNISTDLAAKAHGSKEVATIPDYLEDYKGVFDERNFETLPTRRIWDHAIELTAWSRSPTLKDIPLESHRTTATRRVLDREPPYRTHSIVPLLMGRSCILCQEERWKAPTCPGLQETQRRHNQEPIPTTPD